MSQNPELSALERASGLAFTEVPSVVDRQGLEMEFGFFAEYLKEFGVDSAPCLKQFNYYDFKRGVGADSPHALAHALQDQHYNLEQAFSGKSLDSYLALRSLVEGDAVRISKPGFECRLHHHRTARSELKHRAFISRPEGCSSAQAIIENFPFVFGPAFVCEALRLEKPKTASAFFDAAPESTLEIYRPKLYLKRLRSRGKGGATKRLGLAFVLAVLSERVGFEKAYSLLKSFKGDRLSSESGHWLSVWENKETASRFLSYLAGKKKGPRLSLSGPVVIAEFD